MSARHSAEEARVWAMLQDVKAMHMERPLLNKQLAECEALMRRAEASGEDATSRKALNFHARRKALIERRLAALRDNELSVLALLGGLPSLHAGVMRLRWVERRSWENISMTVNMSARNAQRLQRTAIAQMAATCAQRGADLGKNMGSATSAMAHSQPMSG